MVPRADFLPASASQHANFDGPISIGYGQTNSQPSLVRRMLEWLDVDLGDKVLDVGSGSGWTTALLAHLVGDKGKVYAVEKVPELVEFGRDNVERIGITNAEVFTAGKTPGLLEYAPYERILVSASAEKLPKELLSQLKPGGVMVIPVGHDILRITLQSDGKFETQTFSGFVFVPLVE